MKPEEEITELIQKVGGGGKMKYIQMGNRKQEEKEWSRAADNNQPHDHPIHN